MKKSVKTETRILRLKLVNFIGIYAGMGVTTFEVDFTQTEKRTIILVGANGSGKTTVQSCLTPFASTFDNRSTIIIEGKEGLKEIDIIQDGIIYRIIHHYGLRKNQSFITKVNLDGSEEILNPAGTTRNFPSIIEAEMGLTENYIKLNKIGSKNENFIDFKSSRRKEFIGDFTPDTAEFLDAYANVNEKYNLTTKEIRFITDEASKLTVVTTVEKNIQILQTTIKGIKAKIAKRSAEVEKYKSDHEEGKELLLEIDDLNTKLENLTRNIEFEYSAINTVNERYRNKLLEEDSTVESIKEAIEVREKNNVTYKATVDEAQIKHAELSQSISSTNDEIKRIQKDLDNLTTSSGVKEVKELQDLLKKSTDDLEEHITYLSGIFEGISLDTFESDYEDADVSNAIGILSCTINTVSNLAAYTSMNKPSSYDEVLESLPSFNNFQKLLSNLEKKIRSVETEVKVAEEAVETSTNEFNERRNEYDVACRAKELVGDCALGSDECCLFTKISINTSGSKESILAPFVEDKTNAEEVLETLTNDLDCYKDVHEYLTKLLAVIKQDRNATYEVVDLISTQIADMFEESSKTSQLEELVLELTPIQLESLELTFKTQLKGYNSLEKTNTKFNIVRKLKDKLAGYSSSESTVKLLESNLNDAKKRLSPLRVELNEISTALDEARKKHDAVSKVIVAFRAILDGLANINQYEFKSESIEKSIKQLSKQSKNAITARDKLEGISAEIEALEEELEGHEEDLGKERLDLTRIKEFAERKAKLEIQRIKYALIKDSLDIKTGIPLVLVGNYLNDIRDSTNRLLNIAFKGKFYIDFEISDKEFMIPVYKAGRKSAADILECSQGEIALVKTSLSMGIIAQAIRSLTKQYNIINLDEIDSELDHHNRLVFLDIFNTQLDELHSTQCFIITHNDCFFNSSAALMIFPGAKVDTENEEFMSNKDIIFQF